MKKIFIFVLISIFLISMSVSALVIADTSNRVIEENFFTDEQIPFEFVNGLIIVKGKVNESEKEYSFIFDTGAAISVVNSNFIEKFNLKRRCLKRWKRVRGSSNQTKFLSRYKAENLQIKNFRFSNVDVVATDLRIFEEYTGREIHGIIGGNIIKEFVITINYDKKYIVFSNSEYYKADKKENKTDIKLRKKLFLFRKSIPEITGNIYDEEINFIIDTGFAGGVSVPSKQVKKIGNKFENNLIRVYGGSAKDIFGKVTDSYIVKLENFKIEDLRINEVIANTHGINKGFLGNDFLKRFIVELNYPQNMISLYWEGDIKHNLAKTFGLTIWKGEEGVFVATIIENSSAKLSGLKVGDEILEINSKKVNDLTMEEINSIINNKDIDGLHLKYKRKNKIEEVFLERKKLIFNN